MNRKSAHLSRGASSASRAPPSSRVPPCAPEGSSSEGAARPKRSWVKRAIEKILCMNVAIHKENYHGYVERHTILQNQQQIMAHLQMPPPPTSGSLLPFLVIGFLDLTSV